MWPSSRTFTISAGDDDAGDPGPSGDAGHRGVADAYSNVTDDRRGNTHNGKSQKTLKGEFGELELETPRDRKAAFDPKIVAKGQTRWTGFDDKIVSMYFSAVMFLIA
jgi:hypothetical protein